MVSLQHAVVPRPAGILLLVALLLASTAAAAAKHPNCKQECSEAFDDTLLVSPACTQCDVAGALDNRDGCKEDVNGVSCADFCLPIGGHCQATLDCLADCRGRKGAERTTCDQRFRRIIRSSCGGKCLKAGKKGKKECVKACRQGTPLETSMTTSSTTTSTVSAAAAAADFSTESPCACQSICIGTIVGDCYHDCDEACEGDQQALAICRRGCRDNSCGRLANACTDTGGQNSYMSCCTQCENCTEDLDCVATTTTISTTTTTSSTTVSTTTTTTLVTG
jgi:hypothetical protein